MNTEKLNSERVSVGSSDLVLPLEWKRHGGYMLVAEPKKALGYVILKMGDAVTAMIVRGATNTTITSVKLPEDCDVEAAKDTCEIHWQNDKSVGPPTQDSNEATE